MDANDAHRFIVKLEVYAATPHMEFDAEAMSGNTGAQLEKLVEELREADPDEIEDQTYRAFRFDLCAGCKKRFLAHPLGSPPQNP